MGNKNEKTAQTVQTAAANRFSNLSDQLATEAKPSRDLVNSTYTNIIKGGPQAYRSIAPQIDFAKQQFQNQRKTLRDTVPNGGAFAGANRQLSAAEAGTVSNLYRDNITNALNGLAGYSQGTTSDALGAAGGASSAGSNLANLAMQQKQNFYGTLGGVAGAIGNYFGGRQNVPRTPTYVPN